MAKTSLDVFKNLVNLVKNHFGLFQSWGWGRGGRSIRQTQKLSIYVSILLLSLAIMNLSNSFIQT